jgi:hypothetical protein
MRAFARWGCAIVFSVWGGLASFSAEAADLIWKVENPFRFYKHSDSFKIHERAFEALHDAQPSVAPENGIIWKIERYLNDPDCKNPSTPDTCAASAKSEKKFMAARLGWAARTYGQDCYDRASRPRHYPASCNRDYSWKSGVKEDYILPEAHTVEVTLSPERLAEAGEQTCAWKWKPRAGGNWSDPVQQSCKSPFILKRVPFALKKTISGAAVEVALPDGRTFSEPEIVVEDLLIVALGDSFASGEGNPDRPVTFSPEREIVYDSRREDALSREQPRILTLDGDRFNAQTLPKRLLPDEEKGLQYGEFSQELSQAFIERAAAWTSPDCHRSQYAYPFRVGLQLALEDRHRSITLVHLACSGAEVTEGLFQGQKAREGFQLPNSKTVPAQFDQLNDLICRDSEAERSRQDPALYRLPFVKEYGEAAMEIREVRKHWCRLEHRKRPIDLVFLSIGGNDVGFSALAADALMENAGSLFPIAALVDRQIRFGPEIAAAYLKDLDQRLQAVKEALRDGFGVEPAKVVHTAYERIEFDEKHEICGARPTIGMDVHPQLKINREQLRKNSAFLDALFAKLQCMTKREAGCPEHLATGAGTGFTLVTDHQPEFTHRGICALDPARLEADAAMMRMPRRPLSFGSDPKPFQPYSPANFLPYAHRWRLFRTPNDAFLTANTHSEGASLYDIMQPAYAALYSGAVHPTAEAHAIVADHVMGHVRRIMAEPPRVGSGK